MKKLIPLTLLLSTTLMAAEADNFSAHHLAIQDVKQQVNELSNTYLAKSVADLNNIQGCKSAKAETELYTELRKYFANHSKGELVKEILYKENISKNALPLKQSVYGEWKVNNGYLLGKKSAASSPLALSPLIRIGEQNIGVDKLEHMFGMGFSYFTKHNLEGKSIKKILKGGVLAEKTILGGNMLATGVFAYADLSANFNGMRFWNHVLQKQDDILGAEYNRGPFVKCEDGLWKIDESHPIDFSDYVDASFDESINCSKFATRSGAKKFKKAINERGFSGCPIDSSKVVEMKEKYNHHEIGKYIINDEGLGTVSYLNEF
jgi:hypothetical protein